MPIPQPAGQILTLILACFLRQSSLQLLPHVFDRIQVRGLAKPPEDKLDAAGKRPLRLWECASERRHAAGS